MEKIVYLCNFYHAVKINLVTFSWVFKIVLRGYNKKY